jgi:PmbA protein
MPPTSTLAGGGGFFFTGSKALPDWEQLLSETEHGLIVYSVLGMHTQDASSGHFSLTADQCLLVENGQIKGKVKAVINGDFLGALNREESRLCRVEGEDNPAFAFTASAIGM